MDVMDQLAGKWKVDNNATENFDAFANAMGLSAELIDSIKKEPDITIEFSRDGDQFTTVTQRGQEAPEKLTFKLGAPFTSKSHGLDLENVFTLEGDVLVGKHTFLGNTTTSRRSVKDGKLVIESEGNGVTMKHALLKC